MKEEILQLLNEILRDDMGINIENIGASDLLANYADSDDLSFIFIPEVQTRLGVTIPIHKWSATNKTPTLETTKNSSLSSPLALSSHILVN